MSGAAIAAKVAAGLARAGERTGTGKLEALIIRPGAAAPGVYPIVRGPDQTFTFAAMITQFDRNELASGNVEEGDVKFLLEAGTTDPKTGDSIRVDGMVHQIKQVTAIKPGGVVTMWKVHAEGGVIQ